MNWLILFIISNLFCLFEPTTAIEIKISNLKNQEGQLLVAFFNKEVGFPNKSEKAYLRKAFKLANVEHNTVRFDNLPKGDYAISIVHDENMNGKVDYNFIQVPKEGYGFSNIKKPGLFIPAYSKSKINIHTNRSSIQIPLYYFRN